jgi:lipid-binding SYLF domain-containing protein
MAVALGRSVQAEMLGYSRSRGIFAGWALDDSTLREDLEDNKALFGKSLSNVQIFSQQGVVVPAMGKALVGQLNRVSSWEKK